MTWAIYDLLPLLVGFVFGYVTAYFLTRGDG